MKYLEEWRDSGVDAELIDLNVTSLAGLSPSEYLLYSQELPRHAMMAGLGIVFSSVMNIPVKAVGGVQELTY
jgi:hypothetical protein